MVSWQAAVLVVATALGGETVLLDFHAPWCGPCQQMRPVVAQLAEAGYPVRSVDVDREPQLAARFGVESIPCLVLLIDGQEVDRATGARPAGAVAAMFQRAGFDPRVVAAGGMRGQSPDAPRFAAGPPAPTTAPTTAAAAAPALNPAAAPPVVFSAPASGQPARGYDAASEPHYELPAQRSRAPLGSADEPPRLGPDVPAVTPGGWSPRGDAARPTAAPLATAAPGASAAPVAFTAPAAPASLATAPFAPHAPSADAARLAPDAMIAYAARLKIEDSGGHSWGSGTVIEASGDDVLILTCGHVFRDSQGQGRISIDLFAPGAPRGIPGRVVAYDLKRDVGLVVCRPGVPVPAAPVAPPGHAVQVGDAVVSVGCDNGRDPTAIASQVVSIDKYLGPPNLQVAGQPVQGRSGGGLFTREGWVIGVCNAADPSDNEGLFAALGSIHAQLDEAGLAAVYDSDGDAAAGLAGAAGHGAIGGGLSSGGANHGGPSAPTMPTTMPSTAAPPLAPLVALPRRGAAPEAPVAVSEGAAPDSGGLSAEEAATLSEIRAKARGAEVICVIRSHDDSRSKSEIIVLDHASPEFLEQLASETLRQSERHLTSLDVSAGTDTGEPSPRVAAAAGAARPAAVLNGWLPAWLQRALR